MCMSQLILSNHTTLDLVFTRLSKNLIQLSVSAVWLHYILKQDQGCWNDMKKLSKYCHHHHTKFETYKILHSSFTKYSSPLTKAREFEFCTPWLWKGMLYQRHQSPITNNHTLLHQCHQSPSPITVHCFTSVTTVSNTNSSQTTTSV